LKSKSSNLNSFLILFGMENIIIRFFKLLVTIIITLIILIIIKSNKVFKKNFYKYVYESNISFSKINKLYKEYFGNILPLNIKDLEPVFNEKLIYEEKEKYLDGVKLIVGENYLVPSLNDGVVVFTGYKENYGNVVIINQSDGTDLWYGNLDNINVKLYDNIKKGQYIGNVKNELYLVFKKNGNILDYEKYI